MSERKKKRVVVTVAFAASSLIGLAAGKAMPPTVDIENADTRARAELSQNQQEQQQVVLTASSVDSEINSFGHTSHASHSSHASHASHASHSSHRSGM